MFLPTGIHANKLVPYSELMIFIRCEDNRYCFMQYIQENTIFHSIHAIFDDGLNTPASMQNSANYIISY